MKFQISTSMWVLFPKNKLCVYINTLYCTLFTILPFTALYSRDLKMSYTVFFSLSHTAFFSSVQFSSVFLHKENS